MKFRLTLNKSDTISSTWKEVNKNFDKINFRRTTLNYNLKTNNILDSKRRATSTGTSSINNEEIKEV